MVTWASLASSIAFQRNRPTRPIEKRNYFDSRDERNSAWSAHGRYSWLKPWTLCAYSACSRRRIEHVDVGGPRGDVPVEQVEPRREGFSVDASARIEAADRGGRERLLRYRARPPSAFVFRSGDVKVG